jgi:UDP-N-acetylglucosamine acyltransferase
MSNNTQIAGHVTMGDQCHSCRECVPYTSLPNIGKYAFIAGGSLVSKDVPPYIKAGRTPLSYAGVNSIGLKRKGFNFEQINHILDMYRFIYNKGLNTTQALQYLEEEFSATDERDEIITFIRESRRGIIKRYSKNNLDEDLAD